MTRQTPIQYLIHKLPANDMISRFNFENALQSFAY